MTQLDLSASVPDWVIECPQLLKVFQDLKIDYCCGGKSLEVACQEQGINPLALLEQIRALQDP